MDGSLETFTQSGIRREHRKPRWLPFLIGKGPDKYHPIPDGINMKTNQKWKESINEKLFFMNTLHEKSSNGIYSANNSIKPVNFYCSARGAKMVQLAGDFNHWYPILMVITNTVFWWMASLRLTCTPLAPPAMNTMIQSHSSLSVDPKFRQDCAAHQMWKSKNEENHRENNCPLGGYATG